MRHLIIVGAIGLAVLFTSVTFLPASAQQPTVQRKVLLTHDLAIPGYQPLWLPSKSRLEVARAGTRILVP